MAFQKTQAAGSTRKGAETRAKILDAAARLFAVHGFEATTFAMIGEGAGAATGSIVHCFHDKTALAGIIYVGAMDRLVAAVARAIDRHPTDVPGTIHAVISACFSWAEAHPGDNTLFRALHEHAGPHEEIGKQARLEPLMAAWAQPLIRAGLLQPLAPAQLYAVIIAPAICGAAASLALLDGHTPPEIAWASVLSTAALAAVQPLNPKSRPAKVTLGNAGKKPVTPAAPAPPKQGDLLGFPEDPPPGASARP
jgi:AcrR family transcriptional regulator